MLLRMIFGVHVLSAHIPIVRSVMSMPLFSAVYNFTAEPRAVLSIPPLYPTEQYILRYFAVDKYSS